MNRRVTCRLCVVSAGSILAACGAAMGQAFSSTFESPTYTGSTAGTPITNGFGGGGQAGWYNPVAGSEDAFVFTYAGNTLGVPANPQGGAQFEGGLATTPVPPATLSLVRAQHPVNFSAGGVWHVTYDCYVHWTQALPAQDNVGSFSMQDSLTTRYLQTLQTWGATLVGPTPPTNWTATADHWHLAIGHFSAASPAAVIFDTPSNDFRDLSVDHWYRIDVRWNFDDSSILSASIQDLTAGTPVVVVDVTGMGWTLQGGPNSTLPLPTDIRFFTGGGTGASPGNLVAYDNLVIEPFVGPPSCYPDCNADHALNVNDFICFQGAFAAGNLAQADCDHNSTLNVNDFICFQSAFAAGCSQL